MYLNAVYYGNGYWGDVAAARGYFGVNPYDSLGSKLPSRWSSPGALGLRPCRAPRARQTAPAPRARQTGRQPLSDPGAGRCRLHRCPAAARRLTAQANQGGEGPQPLGRVGALPGPTLSSAATEAGSTRETLAAQALRAKTALSARVVAQGSEQVNAAERRPVGVHESDLGVGGLPEQEPRKARLATCADNEVCIG